MNNKKVKLNENFLSVPIAHRGLHSETICENSMDAFKLAKQNRVAIEIDIHKLSDGKFAVFHDKNLKRITGNDVEIETLTSESLSNYKLWDGQKIPLLEEVLEEIDGKVPILIELKPESGFPKNSIDELLEILKRYDHNEKIAIQSFNPITVNEVKKKTNEFSVGVLASYNLGNINKLKNYILKSLSLFNFSQGDFISYDIRYLPNKYVSKFKNRGVPVLAWVIKDNELLEKAKNFANNIIFEKIPLNEKLYFDDNNNQI